MLAFLGSFLGFFIQDYVSLSDFGWLAAEAGIGTAGGILVYLVFFRIRPEASLRRMQRSYIARARALSSDVAELFEATVRSDSPTRQRAEPRIQRQLLRLNEAALLIDAQLDQPAALPAGWSAAGLHQRLFDAEVGLSNMARFALALAQRRLPELVNALILDALAGVRDGDLTVVCDSAATIRTLLARHDPQRTGVARDDRIVLHRFTTSVTDLATALNAFRRYPANQPPDDTVNGTGDAAFQPQVATFAGWLLGSAGVAALASQERGGAGFVERARMALYARTAIQIGIAVTAAVIVGDAISGRRFYWAVIATFVTFMGANTAGEQLLKGFHRVLGTLVGVIVGTLFAHLVGDVVWAQVLVLLVAIFLGIYLFRVNYTFMVIGVTVMVSQLYVELGEFSNRLLLLRLGETGAGVTIVTILLVLPLHVGRVARVAARQQLTALADMVKRCLDRLADPFSATGSDLELRAAARRVDAAYQALVAVAIPLRNPLLGGFGPQLTGFTATMGAARNYTRNLLLDASTRYDELDAGTTAALDVARRQLATSVGAVTTALGLADAAPGNASPDKGGGLPRERRYVRSASLFAGVDDMLPEQPVTSRTHLAMRDLQLLDGALAEAARWAGVPVTDLDTEPVPDPGPSRPAPGAPLQITT